MATINGNRIIDEIKAKRDKTPKNSGTIFSNAKVLAEVKNSKPIAGNTQSEPPTKKQKFLKQIQDYNDFIVQNDLDAEMINSDHDYDFSAFGSNDDWKVESQRLKDRLSDRMEEFEQIATDGEFAGMELENGVPSYEAVKNMSPVEFKAYEAKYLLGDLKETNAGSNKVDPVVHSENKIKPPLLATHRNNNNTYTQNDSNTTKIKLKALKQAKENHSIKPKSQRLVSDSLISVLPAPLKYSLQNSVDAFRSATKVRDQADKFGSMSSLRDAGRGLTAGIYDSADVVTSLRGLVPNRISRLAAGIADNIRASNEIPNSEVERIGELASEGVAGGFVGGIAGSRIGKAVGSKYKNMKQDAEKFNERIAKLSKDRGELSKQFHQEGSIDPLKNLRVNKDGFVRTVETVKSPELTAHSIYENMRRIPPKQSVVRSMLNLPQNKKVTDPYSKPLSAVQKIKKKAREATLSPSRSQGPPYAFGETGVNTNSSWISRGVGSVSNKIKRNYGNTGMLQKNDDELTKIWKQSKSLDDAMKTRQNHWDALPFVSQGLGMNIGTIGGAVIGSNGL